MYYQHDMAHCTGENCTIKAPCYRYLLYLDVKGKDEYHSYFIKPPIDNGKCNYFIDAKAYE